MYQSEGSLQSSRGTGGRKTFLLSNIQGLLGTGGRSNTGFLCDQATIHSSLAVGVTESWLKPDIKDSELLVNFPGHTLLRCDRVGRKGGGVCLFLCEDISGETICAYDLPRSFLTTNKLRICSL